jgi:molybdopterin molybdotransferase
VQAGDTFGAATESPLPLTLAGESRPGRGWPGRLGAGQAVRIMTGAPLPAGADAVVRAEQARLDRGTVWIETAVPPGKDVGRRGEDVATGARVLSAGRLLRPQDAGLLASLGVSPVPVVRRPRVEILITGDELLAPGEQPAGEAIVDSNSVTLAALVARDGGVAGAPVRLTDDAARLTEALERASGDLILISGGSSVGLEDHAPAVLARVGRLAVHGIAMRPASPAGIGFLPPVKAGDRERPVFLLPGNPVSCLCAYDFFAGRAVRLLGGRSGAWPHVTVLAPLARKVVSVPGRVDYLRVRIGPAGVEPLAISGASILSSTVRADGFVVVPRDAEGHAPGETVTVFLYDAPFPHAAGRATQGGAS